MLVQVHDEIVIRVEESHLDEVLPLVTETMTGVVGAPTVEPILGTIPLIVSAKAGYTWAVSEGEVKRLGDTVMDVPTGVLIRA